MRRSNIRETLRELRWLFLAGALALISIPGAAALTQIGAGGQGVQTKVYKVTLIGTLHGAEHTWTEYIEPKTGRWRIETADGRAKIYDGHRYAVSDPITGTTIRTGSPEFIGYLADAAISRPLVQHFALGAGLPEGIRVLTPAGPAGTKPRYEITRNGFSTTATIEQEMDISADRLSPPTEEITISTVERQLGTMPTLPVNAYWFGTQVQGRSATTTIEIRQRPASLVRKYVRSRGNADLYIVFYELPSAQGRSSAHPGQQAPQGEIQVVNQPVSSDLAQGAIDAFNGVNREYRYTAWPKDEVTLRNGEKATVVVDRAEGPALVNGELRFSSFSVITATTLVSVVAPVTESEATQLASELRPLVG
jgi:hypothetical protein